MSARTGSRPMFGLNFSCETLDEIADELCRVPAPAGGGLRHLVTMNVDHVVHLRKHAEFRTAYRNAWKATIDGMPILLYARLRQIGVKARVTGADLFPVVFGRLDPARHRPFIVASSQGTANVLREALVRTGFDATQFAFHIPEFGFEKDAAATALLIEQVALLRPTHIFFGVGAPKSEIWIDRHRALLGDAYCLSVGAALDFHAGSVKRAPSWMRRIGFEWAWRFAQQPKRLFRRYFVDSRFVIGAIISDLRHDGRRIPDMKVGALNG